MDYTQYTEVYYNILQRNEINICVYCQAQNALYYYSKPEKGNDKNLRWYFNLTLDHILSKSEFPFLAVNINNLAPVCSHCNSRKGKKQTHYNPYIDTFNYRFHFDDIEFELNPLKFNLEKMKLKKIDSTKNEKLNDILDLEGLYKHQSFIAESLIDRFAKFNSKGYYKNVNGVISSITEEDVKYFISDCNMSEDNLLKYPLVRFKIDLYNYLINKHKKKR